MKKLTEMRDLQYEIDNSENPECSQYERLAIAILGLFGENKADVLMRLIDGNFCGSIMHFGRARMVVLSRRHRGLRIWFFDDGSISFDAQSSNISTRTFVRTIVRQHILVT